MIDWSKQHCGTIATDYHQTLELMPDLEPILSDAQSFGWEKHFLFDVKVHMLMPGQYPCIPNWHHDFIPRDENGKKIYDKVQKDKTMFLWVSGEPTTEFFKGRFIEPKVWTPFTQLDVHRGGQAKEHCWRGFIRATPREIYPEKAMQYSGQRRHSQVYLDADTFSW